MKKCKKIFAACLSISLIASLALTGCGQSKSGSGAGSAAAGSAAQKKQGYVIGFSNFSVGNSWRVQMQAEFEAEAKRLQAQGVVSKYYMTNSNNDIAKQIADVKDLITKKVDAILITAASPNALSPVCEQAEKQGIKVISFDNVVQTDAITSKVGIDQTAFGKTCADFLVKKLNGKGNIVVLNGTAGTSNNELRWQGAKKVFDQNPGIKILGSANADWDYAKGKTAMENFLSAYPNIDGVWSQGGAMTQAAIDAMVAANRKLVPMSGEANNGVLKEWKKYAGQGFDCICPSDPTYESSAALDTAVDALQGKKVDKKTVITPPAVTTENLDKFLREDLPDSFWNVTKLSEADIQKMYKSSASSSSN